MDEKEFYAQDPWIPSIHNAMVNRYRQPTEIMEVIEAIRHDAKCEAIGMTLGFCMDRVGTDILCRYTVQDVLNLTAEANAP